MTSHTALARLLLCAVLLQLLGCTANPKPDIPLTDLDSVDPARVRVDVGSGTNRVLVTGLSGAADVDGTAVQVQNLLSGDVQEAAVAGDGSFIVEIGAQPTQVLGLRVTAGSVFSAQIFVAGNAQRNAVPVGSDNDCQIIEDPFEGECLVCTFEGQDEIVGCELDDFSSEAPLNPANIAECLFLSDSELVLEPLDDLELEEFGDVRFAEVDIFNGCGEQVLVLVEDLIGDLNERFFIEPDPFFSDAFAIEPTFFGNIEIFYDGFDRFADDPPDEAELIISVFLPDIGFGIEELGTLVLPLFAP